MKLLLTTLLLLPMIAWGESGKKAAGKRFRQILSLADSNLMDNRALAQQLTGPEFVTWYLNDGSVHGFKRFHGAQIDSLGADDSFAYYAHTAGHFPFEFVKVRLIELGGVQLSTIDASELRLRFVNDVVPLADKNRLENSPFNSGSERKKFSYALDAARQTIQISYKWTVKHDFASFLNRTYTATYDLASGSFREGATIVINRKK